VPLIAGGEVRLPLAMKGAEFDRVLAPLVERRGRDHDVPPGATAGAVVHRELLVSGARFDHALERPTEQDCPRKEAGRRQAQRSRWRSSATGVAPESTDRLPLLVVRVDE